MRSLNRKIIPRGQKAAAFMARMKFGRLGIQILGPKACPPTGGEPRALARVGFIFSIMMFFCLGAFSARAAVDPVVVEVHYQNGVKFYNRGLYKRAVREFENTLSLDPQNSEATEYLQKAKAAANNEQVKDARESKTDEIRRLYEEGKGLYLKRDYKAAIDVFNQILSAKPIDDFASFYKERCEIMIARQLAREKKVEDKKTGHEDVAKKLKELDKQEMLKNRREERAQAVTAVPAREERQRARQEKIDQKKQARGVRQEEKKALAEEKKVKKEEAGQKKNEVKSQKQEKKQEQKNIKELFLKGVEEYGRKEYESAIDSFEAVIEAESNGRKLYSSSAARLMDKTKMKMKEVPGQEQR
ncbi:MAG: hypothetical protein V1840_03410 [Candidatus Omnitrophota bacterium]